PRREGLCQALATGYAQTHEFAFRGGGARRALLGRSLSAFDVRLVGVFEFAQALGSGGVVFGGLFVLARKALPLGRFGLPILYVAFWRIAVWRIVWILRFSNHNAPCWASVYAPKPFPCKYPTGVK